MRDCFAFKQRTGESSAVPLMGRQDPERSAQGVINNWCGAGTRFNKVYTVVSGWPSPRTRLNSLYTAASRICSGHKDVGTDPEAAVFAEEQKAELYRQFQQSLSEAKRAMHLDEVPRAKMNSLLRSRQV